jgi:hypothetical protein
MGSWTCERCGVTKPAEVLGLDYCANCSKNLCEPCMARGCCGKRPAESGMKADSVDDGDDGDDD